MPDASPSRRAPKLGKRAAARKRQIAHQFCAAAEARLARGETLAALPVEQLVAEAGVPRSTFYVYFPDKAAVLREVLDGFVDFTVDAITQVSNPTTVTRDDVDAIMAVGVKHYAEHAGTYRLLADAAATDPTLAVTYREAVGRVQGALGTSMARWAGRKRANRQDRAVASALVWMIERTLYQELGRQPAGRADRLADALSDILWSVAKT